MAMGIASMIFVGTAFSRIVLSQTWGKYELVDGLRLSCAQDKRSIFFPAILLFRSRRHL